MQMLPKSGSNLSANQQVVFFHGASKTLVLADTIQNFELDKIRQPYRALICAARTYAPRR